MTHPLPFGAMRRVAIIGGGISGLGAAHHLAGSARVSVIEAAPRLGGHARTVRAGKSGQQAVDTGFIVFNHANYPHLTALFDELGVETAKSNMSFAASMGGGRVEYALNTLNSLFGQRRNLLRPEFLGMLRDILAFNAKAEALVEGQPEMSIGELIEILGTGAAFRDHYFLPFSGAIWSTPTQDILRFPAEAMLRFFRNHALLGITGQHQWYTVKGGSIEYVTRLEASLRAKAVDIRTNAQVVAVRRDSLGAEVKLKGGAWERFDEVIFATHSDQSLALLTDPAPQERAALEAIPYQPNRAVLHADPNLMPRNRRCWASWNYVEPVQRSAPGIGLSYWMNSLQPIPQSDPLFVTLNPTQPIRDELIYDETSFAHPLYTNAALRAQAQIAQFNGARNTWFAGAWMKNGFHEDGLSSGLEAAQGVLARAAREIAA